MKKFLSEHVKYLTLGLVLCALPLRPAFSQSTAAPAGTKEAALRSILSDVIVPGYQELAAKCHSLTESIERMTNSADASGLQRVRQAWTAAVVAARGVQWLQAGPIADREYLASFYYSKVLPQRMDTVLNSTQAVDEKLISEFGALARGMFALEYLLFPPNPANAGSLPENPSVRRNHYILILARDLEAKATKLAEDWTASGDQGVAAKFVAGGQQSLNLVVNQLAQFIEAVAEQRINFVLLLQQPIAPQLDRIEGSRSLTSQQSAVALLQAIATVYRGTNDGGLEGYLRHLNAPLADRLKAQVESAVSAAKAIGVPLEQAATDKRATLQTAYEKAHALEILFKVDVASALGVTLTFTSGDGD